MLDPRIYRTGLMLVVLAVLVLAFSLQDQPGALSSTLAPDAFNGQNVYNTIKQMAGPKGVQDLRPGSAGDLALADQVGASLSSYGFTVTTDSFSGQTADGPRRLVNVIGVRPGLENGSILVLAHRDSRASPDAASLSGTATLIELARDLEGETLRRTVVLASTSGSQGLAGAIRLATTLNGPIDAVIGLGDLASQRLHQPIVVPWSSGSDVASPTLRNTVAAELGQQATLGVRGTSLFGQYLHLAFPLTVTEQAPFGARGIPAVTVSLSGERGPGPGAPLAGVGQVDAVGRAILGTISALNSGPSVPPASPYVLLSGKVVPGWAISLFVLVLIVPVLLTTIDGVARARRRGHPLWRWLLLSLLAALPFLLAACVVLVARLLGALPVAPPGPVPAGAVPVSSQDAVVLVLAGLAAVAVVVALRGVALRLATPRVRSRGPGRDTALEGAVAGLLAVSCAVAVALWAVNPFAGLLVVPGLHLWLVAVNPDLRLRTPLRIGLVALGVAPLAAAALYYALTFGYGPIGELWTVALLIAGHGVGLASVLVWSAFFGCLLTAAGVLVALARQPRPEQAPVTVRGPASYAGPGSLGGTESALRR